jgi:hypothetical protein
MGTHGLGIGTGRAATEVFDVEARHGFSLRGKRMWTK